MTAPLRVGVVGLGVIARFYLAAIEASPALRLTAVCDHSDEPLRRHRGRVACYRDHRALLHDAAALDLLVVTVPNDAHAAICADALRAGVAVCVEKPLATTLDDGRRVAAVARGTGAILFTAFHRRYNANVAALRRELRSRPPIAAITIRYWERIEEHVGRDRWYLDPRRCGGGCVADNGPNAFDLAALLLGELRVSAATIERDAGGIDRRAQIELHSADAIPAQVLLDWSFPGQRKDVECRLVDGSVVAADMLAGHSELKGSLWHEYRAILAHVERVVRRGAPHDDGGLAALALVDAAYELERSAGSRR